jgi:hypothetical protein
MDLQGEGAVPCSDSRLTSIPAWSLLTSTLYSRTAEPPLPLQLPAFLQGKGKGPRNATTMQPDDPPLQGSDEIFRRRVEALVLC